MSDIIYTRLPSSAKELEETLPSSPDQAVEVRPVGPSAGFAGSLHTPVPDERTDSAPAVAVTSVSTPTINARVFHINCGTVPNHHHRILLAPGLTREEYIEQLFLFYPEVFDQVPSDLVTFSIFVNYGWALISDSSWDDATVKNPKNVVLVKVKLKGFKALLYKAQWISVIGLPFLAFSQLIMGHWIIAFVLVVLYIFFLLRHLL